MPRHAPKVPISVRIDKVTLDQVRARMKDPVRGSTKYASMTDLIERLMLDWLISQNRALKELKDAK